MDDGDLNRNFVNVILLETILFLVFFLIVVAILLSA